VTERHKVDLVDILRAAGRRWYVLLAGILLTVGVGYLAVRYVPVTYDITSSVLLLPPSVQQDPQGEDQVVNPFLNLGGLDVAAGVLVKALTDSASVEEIIPEGSKTEYTVEKDASVSGSVLEVAVNAQSEDEAVETVNQVLELAETRLAELQDEIDASSQSQVRLMVVTDNAVAEPNYGTLIRALIVVAGAGLALTFLLAVSVDALVRRRRAKKAGTTTAATMVTATPDESPAPLIGPRPAPPLFDQFADGKPGGSRPPSDLATSERKPR
jgi:hypothetical protein